VIIFIEVIFREVNFKLWLIKVIFIIWRYFRISFGYCGILIEFIQGNIIIKGWKVVMVIIIDFRIFG